MKRSTLTKGMVAAVAGAMALGAMGGGAQAQPYGQYGYYSNYDPCQREANNRGIIGALVGGGIGATVGTQVAANHHRGDGGLLGGVVGAIAGATVGKTSAACRQGGYGGYYAAPPAPPPPPPPPPAAYNNDRYDGAYRWEGRYDDDDDDGDDGWAYGRRGQRYRIVESRVGADGCTLAESPIYLPDGRVQKRFVRVCMDSDGRYQVVD